MISNFNWKILIPFSGHLYLHLLLIDELVANQKGIYHIVGPYQKHVDMYTDYWQIAFTMQPQMDICI